MTAVDLRSAVAAEAPVLAAGAQIDRRLAVLLEEFEAAHEASAEASERARMADAVWLDDEAERLHGEAAVAWGLVVREASASGAELSEDALDLGWEYWAAQPRVSMPAPAVAGDWRESVAAVDWSRSSPAVTA